MLFTPFRVLTILLKLHLDLSEYEAVTSCMSHCWCHLPVPHNGNGELSLHEDIFSWIWIFIVANMPCLLTLHRKRITLKIKIKLNIFTHNWDALIIFFSTIRPKTGSLWIQFLSLEVYRLLNKSRQFYVKLSSEMSSYNCSSVDLIGIIGQEVPGWIVKYCYCTIFNGALSLRAIPQIRTASSQWILW